MPAEARALPIVMFDSALTLDVPDISIMLSLEPVMAAVKSLFTTFDITFPPICAP